MSALSIKKIFRKKEFLSLIKNLVSQIKIPIDIEWQTVQK